MYSKAGEILDRREMLKVKVKSLADEARIIRKEEKRTHGQLQAELHWHRISDVRSEARASYLAYGLVRGTPLDKIEKPNIERSERLWEKVRAMVKKYGPTDSGYRTELLAFCKNGARH